MKSQNHKTLFLVNLSENLCFLGPLTSILTFLQLSQKYARLYRPFRSFCFLWIFCRSNFYNSFFFQFSIVEMVNISAIYKLIILTFSVNLPVIFIYKFWRKESLIQPPGEPRELNLLNFNNECWSWYGLDISLFIN